WIRGGIPWAADKTELTMKRSGPPPVDARARDFWSFKPAARPPIPPVRNKAWGHNPMDAFVLAKLEAAGMQPAPAADKATLLRRLYYAVIGLPPAPAEV